MSEKPKDGGLAFPQGGFLNQNGEVATAGQYFDASGMTLREYFAAHAPITPNDALEFLRVKYPDRTTFTNGDIYDALAVMRWFYANSMVDRRDIK